MSCIERFRRKREQMKAKLTKAMSSTGSKMKRVMTSTHSFGSSFGVSRMDTLADVDYDWDPEGRTVLSRKFSRSMTRSMSRSMSMGARAARQTVSSKCRAIVKSSIFRYTELFAITANLLLLSLHHEGMSNKLLYSLYALEALFIIAFTAEMVLRFLAVGLVQYMDDQMNIWDTFVIAASAGSIMTRAYPNISGARMLRWFYVDKKEKRKHTSIVADCIEGLGALSAVSFFYLLIIFIFAVIGMELYAGEYYHFYDGHPRDNFDSIFDAMFLWFTCTTADNWVNQMWNAMRPGVANKWIAPFLFVAYFIITVFLVLNLIIAVILEKTELSDSQKKQIQKAEYLKHLRSRQKRLFSAKGSGTWLVGAVEGATAGVKSISKRLYTKKVRNISIPRPDSPQQAQPSPVMAMGSGQSVRSNPREVLQMSEKSPPPTLFPGQMTTSGPSKLSSGQADSAIKASASISFRPSMQGLLGRPSLQSTTLNLGSGTPGQIGKRASQILLGTGFSFTMPTQQAPNTALRNSILALVKQPSEALLNTSEQPLLQQQPSKKPLLRAESRASFELEEYEEMGRSFKMREEVPWYLSNDSLFVFSPDSQIRNVCQKIVNSRIFTYLILAMIAISVSVVVTMGRESGIAPVFAHLNIFVFTVFALEFIMKIIAFGFLLTPDPYLGDVYNFLDLFLLILDALFLVPSWNPTQLVVVRILSAFRPLRMLCRIQGMKVLTTNLLRTIPAVMSVLAFTFIVFSVFAVVGVQLFRGRFSSCNASVDHHINCVGNDLTTAQILGPRVWANPSFHFDNFPSALLSLFIISTFDNVQNGYLYPVMDIQGPKGTQPDRNKSPLNSIFFIIFICVGGFFILRMFVGVFIDQFGLISGSKLLTERQKLLRDTNRIIQRMTPIHKPNVPLFWLRRFCHRIVTSPKYPKVIRAVVLTNYTWLSSHFAGQPAFLTVHRNRIEASFATFYVLDVTVKLLGLEVRDFVADPWNIFELCNATVSETMIMPETLSLRKTIGRIPMGLRIFRVIRYTPRLNTLLRTVIVSMMHMLDIVWLLGILLVSFAIMGVQMFETLRDGSCIGPDMNFRDFGSAFVTLFQIMTGDNWSCILQDAQAQFPFCTLNDPTHGSDCGNSAFALFYFVLFITLATHIFMNMFVASIIDTITFGLLKEKTIITPANLTEYQVLWNDQEFDPTSTGFLGLHKLRSFVNRLGIPLGRRHNAAAQWYARVEWEVLGFHVEGRGIPFRELLETLTLYKIGSRGLELAVRIEREKQIQKIYRYGATLKIQAAIRGFLVRRQTVKERSGKQMPAISKMSSMLFE